MAFFWCLRLLVENRTIGNGDFQNNLNKAIVVGITNKEPKAAYFYKRSSPVMVLVVVLPFSILPFDILLLMTFPIREKRTNQRNKPKD